MKTTLLLLLLSALSFSSVHAYTLPQHEPKSYECSVCTKLSHEGVQDTWSISAQSLNNKVSNAQKSYGYRQRVSAQQLHAGVPLSTLAPGAIVRITAVHGNALPLMQLHTPTKQVLSLKDAATLFSQEESLGDSLGVKQEQTMLQIKPELGFGTFIIKSDGMNSNDAEAYMINVFDKFSLVYLVIETDAFSYHYGDRFNATIAIKDSTNRYYTDDINAALIGPAGQSIPLKLKEIKANQFEASTIMRSELNDQGENWYIEAEVVTQREDSFVRRSGHCAFSYAIPSASVVNIKQISSQPLTFAATIDVATASRYALQSVLYRNNAKGERTPIETSHSAHWLEPGKQVLHFSFDNSRQLAEDTLSLGYLRLTDYGQLKIVYQYDDPIKLSQLVE